MVTELKIHPDPERRRKIFRSIANTEFINIWEGSIRSSKTVDMILAWLNYLSTTDETTFIISGRTLGTLERNLINGDYGILALAPGSVYKFVGTSKAVLVNTPKGVKTCYCFGASDIKAFPSLRGLTAGGWMADEINMHNRDFVQECFNRTALSSDRRHLWTLNPDNPHHWIYKDESFGIDRYTSMTPEEQKAIGGVRYWHFTPLDNPAMTQDKLDKLSKQYTGFAYDRYILGLRCAAEGLIYPRVVEDQTFIEFDKAGVECRYAAVDFGSNHPTVFYIGGPWRRPDGSLDWNDWRIAHEIYITGKDTAECAETFIAYCNANGLDPYRIMIAVDPAALGMKLSLQNRQLQAFGAKNAVFEGILYTQTVLYSQKLRYHVSCRNALKEIGSYTWDESARERGEDKPIKINDDCMDSTRYFAYTHMKPMVRT